MSDYYRIIINYDDLIHCRLKLETMEARTKSILQARAYKLLISLCDDTCIIFPKKGKRPEIKFIYCQPELINNNSRVRAILDVLDIEYKHFI